MRILWKPANSHRQLPRVFQDRAVPVQGPQLGPEFLYTTVSLNPENGAGPSALFSGGGGANSAKVDWPGILQEHWKS